MRIKLLLLGCLSFIVALVATVPITVLLPLLPTNSPIQLTGARGTLWQGEADSLHYKALPLGQFRWKIQPQAFLTGNLGAHLKIDGEQLQVDSLVNVHWDKTLTLSNTHGDIDAAFLQNFKKIPVKLAGNINLDMRSVIIKQQQIPLAEGKVKWTKGQILSPMQLPIGGYSLALTVVNKVQQGRLNSDDAPLDLQGKLSLDQQGKYQTDIKLKAKNNAPAPLVSALSFLGRKGKDGFFSLKSQGKVPFLLSP
jgi:hypothetical protein